MAYLKKSEPERWKWAASSAEKSEFFDPIRTELLKTSYRLDAEGHPELAEHGAVVAKRLGIEAPLTFYQTQGATAMNAMICRLPGEAHILFAVRAHRVGSILFFSFLSLPVGGGLR